MTAENKIVGLAGVAIEDRKTLLSGINDIMEIARQDYGISRTALIKMQERLAEVLKNLKCERFLEQNAEAVNE